MILALYAALLLSVCRLLFGTWMPPNAEKGLWLYAAFAHLLLGSLLLSPYFTKPADAISDAVIAVIVLPEISGAVESLKEVWISRAFIFLFVYYLTVMVAGSLTIVLRGSRRQRVRQFAELSYVLSTHMGDTPFIFSLLFFFALLAFHRESMREFVSLTVVWALIVPLRLFENVMDLGNHLKEIWSRSAIYESLGEPYARKEPNLILLRRTGEGLLQFGQVLAMTHSTENEPHHAMIIDELQLADERWIRCLAIDGNLDPAVCKKLHRAASTCRVLRLNAVVDQPSIDSAFQQSRAYSNRSHLIGLVAPNTDIVTLRFEITRTDLEIGEGQLVELLIGKKSVLYQIINGITQEEILTQKNTYGFARASAKKIGTWNNGKQRFEHIRWIPQLNEPIFLQETETPPDTPAAIGFFPNTAYPVSVDVHQLVTHNGAILGILGAGKTFLALELVERMLQAGIKVIALDLTNQYATELALYYDAANEQTNLDKLKAVGPPGKANVKLNVSEGGSVQAFYVELKQQLNSFISGPNIKLKIYNPTVFEVWRQDSRPYNNQASMAQLTPTEITRIITETVLEMCSTAITDKARVCIVFEEAHSLIPEWNAVASEGDKAATNGTAKAILQGRKYGLGCLVVTQRTANVTKTILNQCNTIFALRVFDATGMEFLKNYVGEDYSGVLSTLEDRHAVVFGRASSCSEPVLVRLNDRDNFLQLNRP
jgi:uncharacterized protein DUF87